MEALERSLLDRAAVVDIGRSLDRTTLSVILGTRGDLPVADVLASGRVPAGPPGGVTLSFPSKPPAGSANGISGPSLAARCAASASPASISAHTSSAQASTFSRP